MIIEKKESVDDISSRCELCGFEREFELCYPDKKIVKCPRCQLVFYSENIDSTKSLYSEGYYKGQEYFDYKADKKVLQINFKKYIKKIRKIKPTGQLLEIGSAYGFFLELAQKYWEVKGLEINKEAAGYAQRIINVNSVSADFLGYEDDVENFDIICMWDTIEHLMNPRQYVEQAVKCLKPGGILCITTGDIGSTLARFRKEHWRLIHPPTHLFYFSKSTLRNMVEQAGLRTLEISHVGYFRSYRSMLNKLLATKKKSAWLYDVFTFGGLIDFPVYLNLYDIMMIIAEKPGHL